MEELRQKRQVFAAAVITALNTLKRSRKEPEVIHPGGPDKAVRLAQRFLDAPDVHFQHLFRMPKAAFVALIDWLRENTRLHDSRYLTAEVKVMVVLFIFGHNR